MAVAVLLAVPSAAQAVDWVGKPSTLDGYRVPARATATAVELSLGDGRFAPRFWAGVNLGATVPGHDPGELAVTRAQYDRWLAEMGRLGVRVVRVYTLLRPRFYEALAAYNRRHPRAPLYLLQGIYLDEERLHATTDLYDPTLTAEADRDIRDTVAVIHGRADVRPRVARASGRYRTSVARWTLGWSFGVEWDPQAVAGTDAKHAGAAPPAGRYIAATADATPTERWIAQRMELLASEEARRGWSRPLTFTNWVSADPLKHPAEPQATEDLVSVDALHVRATSAWPGGSFASYHVYPYYPDFLSLGAETYAGYLRTLHDHHAAGGQALMITEFGVPSSLGIAHTAPLQRDQGDHSEAEQGRINAAMLKDIRNAGAVGGMLFAWIDEWFKRTWNTQDTEQPVDRRRLWRNPLTNEEHFGVLAADVVRARPRGDGIAAATDPEALALGLPTSARRFVVGIDARPGNGGGLPGTEGLAPGADVAVVVDGAKATVFQAGSWEPVAALWGTADGLPPADRWQQARMLVSHPLIRPDTGQRIPAQLRTLAPLTVTRRAGRTEMRLPWSLLGFADPSTRRIFTIANSKVSLKTVAGVRVHLGTRTRQMTWRRWDSVRWRERRKASWPTLRAAFRDVAG